MADPQRQQSGGHAFEVSEQLIESDGISHSRAAPRQEHAVEVLGHDLVDQGRKGSGRDSAGGGVRHFLGSALDFQV
jgi:hypothetical protein